MMSGGALCGRWLCAQARRSVGSCDWSWGRPRARRMLTDTTPVQDRLADLFNINQYAPTR